MTKQYDRKSSPVSELANLGSALVCALALPTAGFARTVYDAGAEFNAAGHNANAFGPWSLLHASDENLATTAAFDTTAGSSGVYAGIGGSASPYVRVNTGATAATSAGETVLPNEFYIHPQNPTASSTPSVAVRFTAPEDGWYSALVFAHDIAKEANNASTDNSGVKVSVRAAGHVLVSQIVSQEAYAANNPTVRFDFQMPVRRLSAGETVEVVIGNKNRVSNGHTSDATGLRFTVTKEDEGAFYDSGIAMTNNLATRYENPYGSLAEGTWYFLTATNAATAGCPPNVSNFAVSRIATQATRASAGNQRGFANAAAGTSPYVIVNESDSVQSSIAPCELHVHPNASNLRHLTTVRFRPPRSGYYSGSIVARDVNKGTDPEVNGVDVYLFVGDTPVTNAYVSLESFAGTAHLSFDGRLVATGEPIDVLVSASGNASSDATALSIIFRREEGAVYDANASFHDWRAAGNDSLPFPDALGGGAAWNLGAKTNAAVATQFYQMAASGTLEGAAWQWWLHGSGAAFSTRPSIMMSTNDVAGFDASTPINSSPLLWYAPREFLVLPNVPGYRSSSPTIRASVPADGIYRARGNARDLDNNVPTDGSVSDGIAFGISVAGRCVPVSAVVYRANDSTERWEAAIDAGDLWLKAGETVDFVVDPRASHYYDPTTLSACYVREGDIPGSRVVNVDIGAAGAGQLSPFAGRGREGFSDWTAWNALRPGSGATAAAEDCREADGSTRRNVTVALERSSAGAAASGATGCAMLDTGVSSTGAADATAFTVSKLVPGAAYTLYLYGTGDAAFTVGGETKGLEGQWLRADCEPCFARFDAAADASGKIAGSFAAASAEGAAFSGLSIVGEFPEYVPNAFVIVVR